MMSRSFAAEVYTKQTVPSIHYPAPHPKQNKKRHGFRVPQDAYNSDAPDLLHVSIR